MVNLNPEQASALEQVRILHERHRREMAELESRIRNEAQIALSKLEIEKSMAANRALKIGVPKRQLGLVALKTSSMQTVNALLDLAAENPALHETPEFAIHGDTVTVNWVDVPSGRLYGAATYTLVYSPFLSEWSVGDLTTESDALGEALNTKDNAWWAEFNKRLTKAKEG